MKRIHFSPLCSSETLMLISNGEEYEILKTVKNTVIKKSSENNEEPHKPHIDTIIRSLKK